MSELAEKVMESGWRIAKGAVGYTLSVIDRLLDEITAVLNKLLAYPAATETLDTVLARHNKQPRFALPFGGDPAAKLAGFETEAERVFEELAGKVFTEDCGAALGRAK